MTKSFFQREVERIRPISTIEFTQLDYSWAMGAVRVLVAVLLGFNSAEGGHENDRKDSNDNTFSENEIVGFSAIQET